MTTFVSCGNANGGSEGNAEGEEGDSIVQADADVPTREYTVDEGSFHHTYLVADQMDEKHIYKQNVNKDNCFIVISKKEYRLYVYEAAAEDTTLVASFPVCYAIEPGPKEGEGDNSTPECGMNNPFRMCELKDASTWCFDFGDGRGPILAFGSWFLRLDLSQSFPDNPTLAANRSIGIHGSTGNAVSVPGRDSHGCVRMLDEDLIILHDSYAQLGTPVIIKGIKENKYPFEVTAQEKLGDEYKAPQKGNPVFNKQSDCDSAADDKVVTGSADVQPIDEEGAPRDADGVVGAGSGMTGTSANP